jgi:hypothetical protein
MLQRLPRRQPLRRIKIRQAENEAAERISLIDIDSFPESERSPRLTSFRELARHDLENFDPLGFIAQVAQERIEIFPFCEVRNVTLENDG